MRQSIRLLRQHTQASSGVTLIELLVVVAIIGILAMVVLTAVNPSQRISETEDSQIRADLAMMRNALEAYAAANEGNYPQTSGTNWYCESCTVSWGQAIGANQWIPELVNKGYLKRLPRSPRTGVGNGFSNCNATNSGYIYRTVVGQPGYKLIAHCTPKTGLNRGVPSQPPSAYCTITSGGFPSQYDDSGLVLIPGGNPAHTLKSMVDPARYTESYAVYTKSYACL